MDNQNFNQPMPGSPQMPQNMGPKSKLPLIIGGIVILIVLVFGGIYLYKNNKVNPPINTPPENQAQQTPENTVSDNSNPAIPAVTCGNFSELSDYVFKSIQSPDSQSVMQMNPYVITSFRWQRNASEPFITYPIINGIRAYYGDQKTYRSNDFLMSAIKNDSGLVSQTINEEAKSLGLIPDQLNTLPFQSFPLAASEVTGPEQKDFAYLQLFAFRKNNDLYSVVLKAEKGYGAQGQGVVTVTCGKAVSGYDKVYNTLNFKADTKVQDAYDNDYVAIADVSSDNTVYALLGSPNHIKIADYYYFNGTTAKLVSKDSYPAQCATLESQKVGKGMRCVDPNYTQRTVNY